MQALAIHLRIPKLRVIVPPAMKKHPIDTAWFLARLEDAGLTMHALVGKIEGLNGKLDYGAIYRMLHGDRAVSLSEALQLAQILDQPLEELAKRALGKKR